MLNTVVTGTPTDHPPLVIAHGLFGSARNWGAIARMLSEDRQVIAVDLRNHGDSPWDPDHSYAALAADLAEVIAAQGGRADVLGHSMGGKAAMVLALTAPERVGRLIVVDIAPVAYAHDQMAVLDAMRSADLGGVTRRSEADERLAARLDDPALRAFLLQSLRIGPGGPAWRLNLEVLAEAMPQIMGFPEHDGSFEGPVLFLAGGGSDYIGREHRAAVLRYFPSAEHRVIPGAGHWVHAEAPKPFASAVRGFLAPA